MSRKFLVVAETFYSIQGEGPSTGHPAVFLRLAGCNLLCKSATWVCDTIEVWKRGTATDFEDVLTPQFIYELQRGAHLVITGGEPLQQQERIVEYLQFLAKHKNCQPYVEIETNGTVVPSRHLRYIVHQWNVSFKLSNSGEPADKRINEGALSVFNGMQNTVFKIVVATEEDVLELVQDFGNIINLGRVTLMPAGATQEELNAVRPAVVEICKRMCMRYTDRAHIVIWNKKTGV